MSSRPHSRVGKLAEYDNASRQAGSIHGCFGTGRALQHVSGPAIQQMDSNVVEVLYVPRPSVPTLTHTDHTDTQPVPRQRMTRPCGSRQAGVTGWSDGCHLRSRRLSKSSLSHAVHAHDMTPLGCRARPGTAMHAAITSNQLIVGVPPRSPGHSPRWHGSPTSATGAAKMCQMSCALTKRVTEVHRCGAAHPDVLRFDCTLAGGGSRCRAHACASSPPPPLPCGVVYVAIFAAAAARGSTPISHHVAGGIRGIRWRHATVQAGTGQAITPLRPW